MEFIHNRPPRLQTKAYYRTRESGRPTSGVYTIVATDEYAMGGHVVVESADGFLYGVNGDQLDLLEEDPDFQSMGQTFLPSEEKLRAFGFTDRREGYWYYTTRVSSDESFNITIPKEPIGHIQGEPVYSYEELVIDEDFGQPSYFGNLRPELRYAMVEAVGSVLEKTRALGLNVRVNPREYSWLNWPEGRPLIGGYEDQRTLDYIRSLESAESTTQEAVGGALSMPDTDLVASLDSEILEQVAALIDAEAENFSWDSLAHGMTMGQYVAPTAIAAYLEAVATKEKKQ